MKTTVDKFGRILIPKEIRETLGLREGAEIFFKVHEDDLALKRIDDKSLIKDEKGFEVYTGEADGDLVKAINRERDKRIVSFSEDFQD